jgi:hypothetical protein
MNIGFVTVLTAVAVAICASTVSADLGDTPEHVAATMKRGVVDVKKEPDRHVVEAALPKQKGQSVNLSDSHWELTNLPI